MGAGRIYRKWLAIIGICLFMVLTVIACRAFVSRVNEPLNPVIPRSSSPDKVILTSEGCCFWVSDVKVSIFDEDDNEHVIIAEDLVYEYDIFECSDIPKTESPIRVVIEFVGHTTTEEAASLVVWQFSNTDELLKNGLLLCFGDATLHARSGKISKNFAADYSVDGEDIPWYQL